MLPFFMEYRDSEQVDDKNGTRLVEYVKRTDSLLCRSADFSAERAGRYLNLGVRTKIDIEPVDACSFCRYETETPRVDRMYHKGGAVSVRNKFPSAPYQWVTVYPPFNGHKTLLSAMDFADLDGLIESEFDMAEELLKRQLQKPDIVGMRDFTNWGPWAGGSKQHPHSQRQAQLHTIDPVEEAELEAARAFYLRHGVNPYDLLVQAEADGDRRIYSDPTVYIGTAFAPLVPGEIVVIPTAPFANIIETADVDRQFIRAALGAFPAQRFYRGVADVNLVVHMAPFEEKSAADYFRWHLHILPRRSGLPVSIGGSELGYGESISTEMPEQLAHDLRKWYREHPDDDLVLPELRDEFASVMAGGK